MKLGTMSGKPVEISFKTMTGKKIDNAVFYINEHMAKDPDMEYKLYVGCDSQVTRNHNVYATVVVIHKVGHGAHVIYTRDSAPKSANAGTTGNVFVRLWGEVDRTLAVSTYLLENGLPAEHLVIDFDFNRKTEHRSHAVMASAMGCASQIGVEARVKPDAWSATYAANKLCR
jgi:predicted RNase H-related nuclease YkuK (DUF458 family)